MKLVRGKQFLPFLIGVNYHGHGNRVSQLAHLVEDSYRHHGACSYRGLGYFVRDFFSASGPEIQPSGDEQATDERRNRQNGPVIIGSAYVLFLDHRGIAFIIE